MKKLSGYPVIRLSGYPAELDGGDLPMVRFKNVTKAYGSLVVLEMCFQHFNLFPHMTALENCMEGPVQVLGLPKAEAQGRSEELLEMVGMIDKKDQHPSRLSGGQ